MRVLVVSPYFPPQPAIASVAVHALARHWASLGDEVTVLTTAKRADQRGLEADVSGLRVVEIPSRGPWVFERGRSAVKSGGEAGEPGLLRRWVEGFRRRTGVFGSVRMPDLTDAWVKPASAWGVEHGPWDVVFSSAGPYTAHLAAQHIVRAQKGATWAAEFRDLWTGNPVHRGVWPITAIERRLERGVLGDADLLVAPTEYCVHWLERATGGAKPVMLCLNSALASDLAALDPTPTFADDGLVRLVHTGTLYPAVQDVSALFAGWKRVLNEQGVDRLRLCVAGQNAGVWREIAGRFGLADRVEVRGSVERSEALRMQRDAAALVVAEFSKGQQGALPGKVFEYLIAGPPIVVVGGPIGGGVVEIVQRAGRGVHGQDAAACGEFLAKIARGDRIDGQRDEAFLASISREAQVEKLVERVREMRGS